MIVPFPVRLDRSRRNATRCLVNSVNNLRHRKRREEAEEASFPGWLRSDEFVGGRLKLKLKSQPLFFLLCVCV